MLTFRAAMTMKVRLAMWSAEVSNALMDHEPFSEDGETSFAEFASAGARRSHIMISSPVAETMCHASDQDGLTTRIKDLEHTMELFMR